MIGSPIACLLQLTEREGVDGHQRQSRQTERYERDVEHVRLLTGTPFNADLRKHSIANWGAGRKDFIRVSLQR